MTLSDKFPAVDVIIVNYNGMVYLPACLESLFKTDYPLFSVTLVDNASQDGSVMWVKERYPEVRLIRNRQNLGFGRANNIGIEKGSAPYIALLNSDTVVKQGWLKPLVETARKNPYVAATCSKLLFLKNPHMINGVGGGMTYVGYGYDIGAAEVDKGQFDEEKDVFFPTAAACVFKRSAFEAVGGFDERFFMYHEDVDLGWRLRLKGYGVKCVPRSVVLHAFGGTSLKSGGLGFRNHLGQRHALRSLIKNYEVVSLLKVLPLFVVMGFRNAIRGRSLDFLKCLRWNMKRLPDTLHKRKIIQKTRTIRDKELVPFIWQDIALPHPFPDDPVAAPASYSANRKRTVFNGISVIIPTFNRIETLLKVLGELEAQDLDRVRLEVIVVDDGSTDATEKILRRFMSKTPLNMKYFRQTNQKQGAARNLGFKHAHMPLIVFMGDDIIPTPSFLREHLRFHHQNNRDGKMALIGYTTWPEDMRTTPFMRYIGEYGYQFGYSLIHGNGPLPFNFFYTSNISIPRELLDELEYLFEEDFDTYGWEDIELGYRLENRGMRLFYYPSAAAYHDHPVDIPAFCKRQLKVGRASRIFLKKHPELKGFLGDRKHLGTWTRFPRWLKILERIVNVADMRFLLPFPHALYGVVLKANYAKGALER